MTSTLRLALGDSGQGRNNFNVSPSGGTVGFSGYTKCPGAPVVWVFGCCAGGLFTRRFTLAQFGRARAVLGGCEIFNVSLEGGGLV